MYPMQPVLLQHPTLTQPVSPKKLPKHVKDPNTNTKVSSIDDREVPLYASVNASVRPESTQDVTPVRPATETLDDIGECTLNSPGSPAPSCARNLGENLL